MTTLRIMTAPRYALRGHLLPLKLEETALLIAHNIKPSLLNQITLNLT